MEIGQQHKVGATCGSVFNCFLSLSEAFDTEFMCQTLKDIVEGKVVEVPTYDFVTHSRQ